MQTLNEEWPEVITDEKEPKHEYGRVSDAVGELTSAILDCKLKGLLVPSTSKELRGFLTAVLQTLDE